MSLEMVTGTECLNYINRKIGFCSHDYNYLGNVPLDRSDQLGGATPTEVKYIDRPSCMGVVNDFLRTTIMRWTHDTTQRKIGLVLGRSFEGGYEVALLGNEEITNVKETGTYGGIENVSTIFDFGTYVSYTQYPLEHNKCVRDFIPSLYPMINPGGVSINVAQTPKYSLHTNMLSSSNSATFEESTNFNPIQHMYANDRASAFGIIWKYADQFTEDRHSYVLTNDKTNTMVFGVRDNRFSTYPLLYMEDPLKVCSGNLYQLACDLAFKTQPMFLGEFYSRELLEAYFAEYNTVDINNDNGVNMTAIPYNLILTYDENQAKRYLQDGTLPSDAFLFPLDFDNLPKYVPDDSSDEDDDDGQGDLDDDSRDCDSDLPEVPTYTPNSLNNNNVYLLTAGELNDVIDWLWNDVGDVQDIGDLVTKIQGLTSDLIQNFLMFRVMPVKPEWIGGAGSNTNFIVGPVEKSGQYLNLAKGNPPIVNIGSYNFGSKFNTFKFLNYSPYSDFKLYLPYHGIVDIDVSVFQGHSLDVKAVYDYMTGTITYMIYSDNTWLVNTYTAKMAVDLSVSLQTKNDRDSAIFGNVSNAVAGVMSAGASVASGNPIGLVMGAQALVQQTHSAPFKAMGQVGEMGAFYTPQRCKVLIRRPVPTAPKTYNKNVGRQAYYSTTLAKLKGKGYTKCINPRLKFTKTIPLADEEEKINQLLSEGVYL